MKIGFLSVGTEILLGDTVNTNLISVTGLDPSTQYRWRVKAICLANGSNNSGWTSFRFFNTLSSIRSISGDSTLANNLNIYPNPNRGIFNVSFLSEEIDDFEITILDAYGKILIKDVRNQFIGEYTKQIDLGDYPRGVYMVQIRTRSSFVNKRVIVQ